MTDYEDDTPALEVSPPPKNQPARRAGWRTEEQKAKRRAEHAGGKPWRSETQKALRRNRDQVRKALDRAQLAVTKLTESEERMKALPTIETRITALEVGFRQLFDTVNQLTKMTIAEFKESARQQADLQQQIVPPKPVRKFRKDE